MNDLVENKQIEELSKSCPRCGGKSANSSNPQGRCRSCLNKLKAAKKTPGSWQRAQTKADDSLRRQDGKNGTASHKSKGRGTRKEIVNKMKNAERKTGQKLSPDRKDNSRGYASSNVRAVPEKLNRGRHHVDGKKLRAWQKRLKKSDTEYDEFYTYLLAKANENGNEELMTLLHDMHYNDVANFINNEDGVILEKAFTPAPKMPKGACTCGAHAVGTNMHSDFCDGLKPPKSLSTHVDFGNLTEEDNASGDTTQYGGSINVGGKDHDVNHTDRESLPGFGLVRNHLREKFGIPDSDAYDLAHHIHDHSDGRKTDVEHLGGSKYALTNEGNGYYEADLRELGDDVAKSLKKSAAQAAQPNYLPTIHQEVGKTHTVEVHPDMDHLYNVKGFVKEAGGKVHVSQLKKNPKFAHIKDRIPSDAKGQVTPDIIDKHIESLPKKKVNVTIGKSDLNRGQRHRELSGKNKDQYVASVQLHPETIMSMTPEQRQAWDSIKGNQHSLSSDVDNKHQIGWTRLDPWKANTYDSRSEWADDINDTEPEYVTEHEPNHNHWHLDEIQSDFQNKKKIDDKLKNASIPEDHTELKEHKEAINVARAKSDEAHRKLSKLPADAPLEERQKHHDALNQAQSEYVKAHDAHNDKAKEVQAKRGEGVDVGKLHETLSHGHEDPQHLVHSATNALARKLGIESLSMDTPEDQVEQSSLATTGGGEVDPHFAFNDIVDRNELNDAETGDQVWDENKKELIDKHSKNPHFKSAMEKLGPEGIKQWANLITHNTSSWLYDGSIGVNDEEWNDYTDTSKDNYKSNFGDMSKETVDKLHNMSGPERNALSRLYGEYYDKMLEHAKGKFPEYFQNKPVEAKEVPVHQLDTYKKRPKKLGYEMKDKKDILGEDYNDPQEKVQWTKLHKKILQMRKLIRLEKIELFAKAYVEKYQPLEKSSEVSLFQRFEDKYILPASLREDLEKTLAKHLTPDYPDKKTKFTFMKSTYFDSAALDMVQHHLSKAESRFKIRTREYAPDGKLHKSDFTYLEVKAKHGNVSDKFRIKVPNGHMDAFSEGKPLVTDIKLAKANPHIGVADLVKRVDDLNNAMSTFMLRPSCEISYARSAFSDGATDGLRVTFDQGVRFNVLNDGNSGSLSKNDPEVDNMIAGYDPKNHIILEVKHHGIKPDWLTQFLNKNNIAQTSFSKYVYSMGKHTKNKS